MAMMAANVTLLQNVTNITVCTGMQCAQVPKRRIFIYYPEHPAHQFNSFDTFKLTLTALVFLVGTIGNAATGYCFAFTKRRKQAGSFLVAALALTDLLASAVVPIYFGHKIINRVLYHNRPVWHLGKGMCYISPASKPWLMTASVWLLVAISIERFR